jgi:transposase-like protein
MKPNRYALSTRNCPYEDCPGRKEGALLGPQSGHRVRKKGYYRRSSDSQWVARFKCLQCLRSFSSARFSPCFNQKRRRLNEPIRKLLCSGVSQRSTARLLRTNLKTVARKLDFLRAQAEASHQKWLESLREKYPEGLPALQFDEMESFERTKCLPLSLPLAVLPETRKILGFRVAEMPAKGPLASISRKKYGKRKDHRAREAHTLFLKIAPLFHTRVEITTDQNPRYPDWLKPHFPQASHTAVKGRRGCVVGQGELKKIGWDPLFSLNHTAAMIRAHINRMFRRTWCTTKRRDRLEAHLWLYVQWHNEVLTAAA